MTAREILTSISTPDSLTATPALQRMLAILTLICLGLLSCETGRAQAAHQTPPAHHDAISQLIDKMTLEEKVDGVHTMVADPHAVAGVPRLGIPVLNMTNGPAGVTNGGAGHMDKATSLPAAISLAATWDVNLAHEFGAIIGSEAKSLSNGVVFGPDINIARVPQNGRSFESFGEDPYLTGQITVAESKGIQEQGVIAQVKHYAANNQETDRLTVNEIIDERTLREIYLPAFEAAVKQAQVGSIMCAYNQVNGKYACESDMLLRQILRDEWGFNGFVNSDLSATHSTVPFALAGLDVEMPAKYFAAPLQQAVANGQVPMPVLNDMLYRRFSAMKRFGIWENPPALKPIAPEANATRARTLAAAGIVLLKNDRNLLPLDSSRLRSIAVIGPYAGAAETGGGGSSKVTPPYTVSPVTGIQDRAGSGVRVTYAEGLDIPAAVSAARGADVAILMLGDKEYEGLDHPIYLRGNQNQLATSVIAANPRTVIVLKSGGPVTIPWANKAPAILEAWYPGQEDGNAVAEVLFGDFNPSAKLPITFPARVEDAPANTPERYPGVNGTVTYSEGVFVGYRHYDQHNIAPLFPFGHGLSYTTFGYKNLAISPDSLSFGKNSSQTVSVDFDVSNTGKRAGAEVAQLYVGMPNSAVPEPPKWLKGFARPSLAPGQTEHVHITLDSRAFSYWDVNSHSWKVAPGEYQIMIGSSSRDIRLQGKVALD